MEIAADSTSTSNPTVIKLEYSPETLEKLDKLNNSSLGDSSKKMIMRRLLGDIKQCCICQALPHYEVMYPLGNATKIEKYCHDCYNKYEQEESKYVDPNKYFILATKS